MRIVLFILMCINTLGDAAVTLTSNNDPYCLGQTSRLTCTHPLNDGSLVVFWERNGTKLIRFAGIHSLTKVELTYTILSIHLTKDDFADEVWIYRCYTLNIGTSVRDFSSEVMINAVEVPSPKVSEIQPKSNVLVYKVEHHPNMECYSKHTFQYHVIWYPVINGVPDETQLQNGSFSNNTVMIDGLMSDMNYEVNITAECVGNEDVVSDPLSMNSMTVEKPITFNLTGPVCYDRQAQLTCHHHDITDSTSSGPIFNQTSPVVWMKDGERIDQPNTYHMVVSQSKTETVVSVTIRKSVFLNGEANYSCAVVYADGSMEESNLVTVRVRAEISFESLLHPTSLTSTPSDTSISLIWSHSDECFENCTFMYEVTWQQSGDGSSLRNTITTETSYTIEGLNPGASYEIRVIAYCKEDPNIRSEMTYRSTTTKTLPPAGPVVNGVAVGVPIALVVLVVLVVVILAVVCIMVPRFRRKMRQLFGKVTSKRWKNGNREMTMNQAEVVTEKYTQVIVPVEFDNNHPEDGGEPIIASDHPTRQSQEKCNYVEVDHSKGDKPRHIPNKLYGDGNYDEVKSAKVVASTGDIGDGDKDTHEIKGQYVTVDHSKGENPRHQPNPNLGDGKYAEIKKASEEFAFEDGKSEMVNNQTSRLEMSGSDAEFRAGGRAYEETTLVGTKKLDVTVTPTQETNQFESSEQLFPFKMQLNHCFDKCVPTFGVRLISPTTGDEEEEVSECSFECSTASFRSDADPAVAHMDSSNAKLSTSTTETFSEDRLILPIGKASYFQKGSFSTSTLPALDKIKVKADNCILELLGMQF